jgi:hypothetical protein
MRDEIAIVPSQNIDREKWDRCIGESSNTLIYAHSIYLDHLTDNWTGLVMNDYDAVMPVAWRKKWGIRYACDVPFIQQLGVFSKRSDGMVELFMKKLFKFFRYGKYPLNYANPSDEADSQTNYILHLNRDYEAVSRGFSTDVIQNIKRSLTFDLTYEEGEIDEAIDMFMQLYGVGLGANNDQFERFRKLCKSLDKSGNLLVRRVAGAGNEVLAMVLMPRDKHRMYNILNSITPGGKQKEANYFLFSRLWNEFGNSGMIFDFEGSDIRGVKEFYRKFGGINQPYFKLSYIHLL